MINVLTVRLYMIHAFVLLFSVTASLATPCEFYLNNGPLSRATAFNEERLSSSTYSGLAQRFNGLTGQMTGIRFWARAVGSSQTIRVILYQESVGFPSTIIAQTTALVPALATWQQIDATFASAVNVSGNVILSIEPSTPSTNDIWLKHNLEGNASNNFIGNGGGLYLNLVRQGVTWYKDLSNGDPSWDYDFMIMPISTLTLNPGFSFNANNLSVTFTNSSTNASTYSWDFGDGSGSTIANPSHLYASSGAYQVKLVVGGPAGSGCSDSVIQTVVITNTSVEEWFPVLTHPSFDPSSKVLRFLSMADQECIIFGIDGKVIDTFRAHRNEEVSRQIKSTSAGVFSLRTSRSSRPFRFIVH